MRLRLDIGLDGKTLAEAAGIKIEGENPWLTMIQNASESGKKNRELSPTESLKQ